MKTLTCAYLCFVGQYGGIWWPFLTRLSTGAQHRAKHQGSDVPGVGKDGLQYLCPEMFDKWMCIAGNLMFFR
jgi:hypothetical protein